MSDQIEPVLTPERIAANFSAQSNRVSALAKAMKADASDEATSDIGRAGVVFLHASLEESVRQIVLYRSNEWTPDLLAEVPLAATSHRKSEKFTLAQLAAHRGATVDDVLTKSVQAYLNTQSVTSVKGLMAWLGKVQLSVTLPDVALSALERMIQRRHRIVHFADYKDGVLERMSPTDLVRWVYAAVMFVTETTDRAAGKPEQEFANSESMKSFYDFVFLRMDAEVLMNVLTLLGKGLLLKESFERYLASAFDKDPNDQAHTNFAAKVWSLLGKQGN